MSFRERLKACMSKAREEVRLFPVRRALDNTLAYFDGLGDDPATVPMRDFSTHVEELIGNPLFRTVVDQKKMGSIISIYASAVHPKALGLYLKATRDFCLGTFFVEKFFSHAVDLERDIPANDPIVWDAKRALEVIKALETSQVSAFARLILDMFPKIQAPVGATKPGFAEFLAAVIRREAYRAKQASASQPERGRGPTLIARSSCGGGLQVVARKSATQPVAA